MGTQGTVKVRHTGDNWATYTDEVVYGSFNFYTTGSDLAQYAVCYTVNGVEYWDNNFGSNYTSNDVLPRQ
jgi:hypothetical protein